MMFRPLELLPSPPMERASFFDDDDNNEDDDPIITAPSPLSLPRKRLRQWEWEVATKVRVWAIYVLTSNIITAMIHLPINNSKY